MFDLDNMSEGNKGFHRKGVQSVMLPMGQMKEQQEQAQLQQLLQQFQGQENDQEADLLVLEEEDDPTMINSSATATFPMPSFDQ